MACYLTNWASLFMRKPIGSAPACSTPCEKLGALPNVLLHACRLTMRINANWFEISSHVCGEWKSLHPFFICVKHPPVCIRFWLTGWSTLVPLHIEDIHFLRHQVWMLYSRYQPLRNHTHVSWKIDKSPLVLLVPLFGTLGTKKERTKV